MHPPLPQDKRAGYIGLIAGFISIVITVIVIVELTNRSFDSHAAPHGPPAAGAQHAPPPAGTPAPAPATH